MVSYFDVTDTELKSILKSYIGEKEWLELNNFDYIIRNAVVDYENKEVKFSLSYFNLILNFDDLSYKDAEPDYPFKGEVVKDSTQNDEYIQERMQYYDNETGKFIG